MSTTGTHATDTGVSRQIRFSKSVGVDRENSSLEGAYTPPNEAQRTTVASRLHYNCLRDRHMPDITTSGPPECPPSTPTTSSVKEYRTNSVL